MNTVRILYHLAVADFYERARRSRFLLILAAVIYLGVLVNNGTMGLDLGALHVEPPTRFHGVLNSAWIGTMTVMVANTFLGLLGFYLVSDCIQRDIRTGVGQIIATTPISRAAYLLGKWISNFIVLAVLVLILAIAAVIMVLFQGETALDLESLLMPFLAVALPYMALNAALAVFYETVPWLRGAFGSFIYFAMWIALLFVWFATQTSLPFIKDPIGYNIFGRSLYASASAAFPDYTITKGLSVGVYNQPGTQFKVFDWPGVDWTPGIVGMQWSWAALGLGLVLLSALWFARFDPSREGLRLARRKLREVEESDPAGRRIRLPHITLPSLSPLVSRLAQANPFLGVLFAELRLLFNGRGWLWWAVTLGLNYAVLTSPPDVTMYYLLPAIWLWPMSIWSGMGNREQKHNTSQIVFSSARPVLRQLPAAWLAGVLGTALLASSGAAFFILNSDLPGLAGWAGAVVFVPTLALALGVFSSGNRAFEVIYLLWWYAGPMSKNLWADFTFGAPQVYLLAAAALLLASAFWRGRHLSASRG